MTVLCAAQAKGVVAIAADSRTSAGGLAVTDTKDKIWRKPSGGHDWIFAGTGAVRTTQVIRYVFSPPHGDESDLLAYMVSTFVPALRTTLIAHGLEHKENEVTTPHNVGLLIARGNQLFHLNSDYCVIPITAQYWAAGSGCELAIGAMHATAAKTAEAIVTAGVEAAKAYDLYCGGDTKVETTRAAT